ncbi:hypothetical protein D0809_31065, partial [Flavobacterium circumlabens]
MKKNTNSFLKKISSRYFLVKIAIFLLVISSVHSCKRENRIPYKEKDYTTEITKFIDSGDVFFDTNKRDSAFYYFNKALSLTEPTKKPD